MDKRTFYPRGETQPFADLLEAEMARRDWLRIAAPTGSQPVDLYALAQAIRLPRPLGTGAMSRN